MLEQVPSIHHTNLEMEQANSSTMSPPLLHTCSTIGWHTQNQQARITNY
jgi:hypothetical protein